jgi:hypothetical protein
MLSPPPESEGGEFANLRHAIELAIDRDFQRKREAYYDWARRFAGAVQGPLSAVSLDRPSMMLFEEELRTVVEEERAIVRRHERLKMWTPVEFTLVTLGTLTAAAPFVPAALGPWIGLGGAALGFGGWAASKLGDSREPRPLGGASMFVAAENHFRLRTS